MSGRADYAERNYHILALVGGIVVIAMIMPLFIGGGNVPTGDGLDIVETAFQVIYNNTGANPEYNVTSDQEVDSLELIAGTGMQIDVDSLNDRITFTSTGGVGGGEVNTASNIGGGTGLFAQKVLSDLEFKSLTTGGDGIVITSDADSVDLSLNNIPKSEISLTGTWVDADLPGDVLYEGDAQTVTNKDISSATNTYGSIHLLSNVTSNGCASGEILKVSGSNWVCATDNVGGSADIIQEGNSNVEVIDAGTGQVDVDIDGANEYIFTGSLVDFNSNRLTEVGTPTATTDAFPANRLGLLGNMVTSACSDTEVLAYQTSNSTWICATNSGGGGITSINGDATAAQVFSGTSNQITITDTGAGTLQWDVGTDVVQIDQANTFADGNIQTFQDDFIRISDLSNDHYLTISVNELTADRVGSVPALTGADVFVFQSASQTLTNKGIALGSNTVTGTFAEFNTAVSDATLVDLDDAQTLTNKDISSTTNTYGSIHQLSNVTSTGCNTNEILKVSGTTWVCATDNVGGSADIIQEGDSNVEVIDAGTGQVDVDIDTTQEFVFTGSELQFNGNNANLEGGLVQFDNADTTIDQSSTDMFYDVATGGEHDLRVNNVIEYGFNATDFDVNDNQIAGSMGCNNGEILEYNSATDNWECGADDTGGGSNALLDGSVHTDTVAQTVTRGSIIYGDATPNWNELTIGGTATFIRSDGTDLSWSSILDTDLPANVVLDDEANTYVDTNMQTFQDDFIRISDLSNDHYLTISVNEFTADRVGSVPALAGADVFVFQAASQTLTNKGIDLGSNTVTGTFAEFNTAVSDATLVDLDDAQTLTNKDISSTTNTYGSIHQMSNVTSTGCASGQVLKVSGTSWVCATDNVGGSADIIQEGDSNVEVIDAGTGQIDIDIDTTNEYVFTGTQIDLNQNNIVDSGSVSFDDANTSFEQSGSNLQYDVATGGLHDIRVNDASEFSFNATDLDVNTNTIKGSMGCTNGQILEYNSGTDRWACGADDTGGGSNVLLDGSVHTDTVAQTVTRGSIIYGDATPNWNELTIGGSATFIRSDGTDLSWSSILDTDLPANVVLDDEANTYTDTNMQTFQDDFIRISDLSNDHYLTISVNELTADRVGSIPALSGADVFVFQAESQTLTNKGIDLGSNTVTGTFAEFNTAVSDATLVDLDDAQTLTNKDISSTTNTYGSIHQLSNVTSTGCASGEVLKVSGTNWVCGTDNGGGGNTDLLDGTVHQDTVAQTVTRGSIIYGDATPNWNELTIGGSATFIRSDGTDLSWQSIVDTDLPANVVLDDEANTYTDTNMQTFQDDFIRISDLSNDHYLTISVNELAADRVGSIPALTGADVFVFQAESQTLTNKGIALGSNTLTGTTAEFNTANSDGTFVTIENTHTYNDGIKQTFNPDATNAGINVGSHSAEPSSPAVGDIFYDSTAGTLKGYDGTWVDLMQGGGGGDIISEGDSNVEVIDLGTGQVDIDIDGANQITFSETQVDFTDNELININSTGYNVEATFSPTHSEGLTWYDQSEHAFVAYNDEAEVTQQLGQEDYIRVYNNGGATINNGQVVYISGAEGVEFRPTVALARSDALTTSEVIGVATHDIEASTFGYITAFGLVNDFDTSAFSPGDPVYLDPTTAGALTATAPSAPNYDVLVGYIVRSDVSAGRLLVNLNPDLTAAGGDASELVISVEKDSAGTINAGDAVYIAGYDNGASITTVELADASSATTMAAVGIARSTITSSSAGDVVMSGRLVMDTSSWNAGDDIYVSNVGTTGNTLQNTKPTGTDLVQKVGVVARSNAASGVIEIFGAGRSNDVPNVFVGDPSKTTLTCGAGQPQVTASPPKATIDGTALDYVVCDYSDGVTERLVWTYEMPDDMDSTGNIDMTIHFTTTGTAGVCWDVAFLPLVSDEVIDGTWSTLAGGCDSATVTGDLEEATISVASGTHGVVGGDTVFIKLERDFADATDTNTNDARFISMEMAWN